MISGARIRRTAWYPSAKQRWPEAGQPCSTCSKHTPSLVLSPSSNSTQACQELFCPIYSLAVSEDPLLNSENATQLFLAVGLDSGALMQAGYMLHAAFRLQPVGASGE